ncbi:hypothetical protein RUM44_000190 [Polyplax serrata]|uniref:Uncharacterized protein n=1 Tax=Polyplax serrata TaxID=468196 RepID=A0ABR1B4P9_POLSC
MPLPRDDHCPCSPIQGVVNTGDENDALTSLKNCLQRIGNFCFTNFSTVVFGNLDTQGDECLEIIRLLNNQVRTKTKVNDEDNEETGRFAMAARYSAMDVKADDSEGRTFLENLNKLTEKFQETYPILIK